MIEAKNLAVPLPFPRIGRAEIRKRTASTDNKTTIKGKEDEEEKVTKTLDLITMLPTDSDDPALKLLGEEEFGKQCTAGERSETHKLTHDLVEDVKKDASFRVCSERLKLLRQKVKEFDAVVKYLEGEHLLCSSLVISFV